MIKLKLTALEEAARSRPAGYLQEVLAAGRVEAGFLWLSDDLYASLCVRFGGDCKRPASMLARARFTVCKACSHSREQAFGCEFHRGCCFGQWRSNVANKCPKGKW
ncbi:MAG: hypothetical protein PHW60_03945 [Kiritimatiellae bacterium]|nr:hypothetical protein [Kiritimatiellia bacterium]